MVTGDASSWLSMAFFGITGLGYQDPFQAAQIPAGENVKNGTTLAPLVPTSPYISYGRYEEVIRRHQDLRTPKQTQKIPLTTAQQYGWWLPQDPKEKPENVYPWIQSSRYPMINSPMTRFVDQMAITNKEFHLF
ncbi:sperm microtubule inner protein 11 [Eleutherodactylus coqui]|uniref:sperm microtubule inner protein 11 n=1 Tax=Eleutherodactylus coqui TaxID=57060 RepID=UPI003462F92E